MAKEQSSVGNILFRIFWWMAQLINPKWSHKLMYWGLRDGAFPRQPASDPILSTKVWGHTFPSPIGIGEGVDKKGNVLDALISMGYSFGEFGPYTLEKEMPEKKSSFVKKEKAIVVQCRGYRNPGIVTILPWFVKRRYLPHYVGVDIAIPTDSEEQNIKQGRHFTYQEEFVLMAQKLSPYCDYLTLNFSHPSSELAMMIVDSASIVPIIKSVKEAVRVAAPIQTPPILVKIPLDITIQEIPLVVKNLIDGGADGVIVGGPLSADKNTNLLPETALRDYQNALMYGQILKTRVVTTIRHIYKQSKGMLPIVAYGCVLNAEDAFQMISSGASLIQLDSACLTYGGPASVFAIHRGLIKIFVDKGFPDAAKAVGSDFQNTVDEEEVLSAERAKNNPYAASPASPVTPVSSPVKSQATSPAMPQANQGNVSPLSAVTTPIEPVNSASPAVNPNPTEMVQPQQTNVNSTPVGPNSSNSNS